MCSFRLHSKYNPHKEAEQFAGTIEGNPLIIVITEPGESYLAPILKTKFPCAKRIAVRYTDALFSDSDDLWDAVWRPENGSLPFFLLSHIPDEKLAATRFLSWKAADKAFPEESVAIWKNIRHAIELLTSVMHTRSFFGNKWLKNTIYNFIHLTHPVELHFGTRNFIIAGAGPSLQQLTAAQGAPYSTLAVTSACTALTARNIRIDLCIATDAGYWALRLFDDIPAGTPIAFPLEAAVPSSILERHPCIPLSYGTPLETALFTAVQLRPLAARENGTVTGTACELLLTHTNRNIVLAGVDLTGSKGFSHAQPHSSTLSLRAEADRFHPLMGMLAVRNFQTQSLETYRQWFLQLPPTATHRIFRAGTQGAPLPNIRTVNLANGIPTGAHQEHNKPDSTKKAARLSVQPYRCASTTDRRQTALSLLRKLRTDLTEIIIENPARLADTTAGLEKQICALCSYTAYCNAIKNPTDMETRTRLAEQTNRVLDSIIKRIAL